MDETYTRLRSKAQFDGLTLADEIIRLLDIADQFDALTLADHPLARSYIPDLRKAKECIVIRSPSANGALQQDSASSCGGSES
jgi:hypothetical protein